MLTHIEIDCSSYHDLQALCKKRKLPAVGKKEILIQRLKEWIDTHTVEVDDLTDSLYASCNVSYAFRYDVDPQGASFDTDLYDPIYALGDWIAQAFCSDFSSLPKDVSPFITNLRTMYPTLKLTDMQIIHYASIILKWFQTCTEECNTLDHRKKVIQGMLESADDIRRNLH